MAQRRLRRAGQRGDVFLYMIGIAVASIVVFSFFYYTINRNLNKFIDGPNIDPGMQSMVDRWKREAPLVVVGIIRDMREEVNEKSEKDLRMVMSYAVMDLQVEYVERGKYTDSDITAYFGWYSTEPEDDEKVFPQALKQDYRKGDRVRLYLDYDQTRYGFYTPWSYYTVEPVQ